MSASRIVLLLTCVLAGCAGPPAGPGVSTPPAEDAPPGAAELLRELESLMAGHTDQAEEKRIISLLRAAAPEALEHVVRRVDLRGLLGDVDDHLLGPAHRSELLALLARERLGALSVPSRAALITALQVGSTSASDEVVIRDVLLATRGAALTALKNAIDEGGDYHDLEQLMFHDVDDAEVREAIFSHFAREADGAGAAEVKVLSDIDDTLYRNLADERYPPKAVYPGVRALYRELDRGPDEARPGREGDLAFLTARPGDRPGFLETETRATIGKLGVSRFVVLTGTMTNLTSHEAMAAGKFEAFERFRRLYPEYRFVFAGDSGQGDAIFAARLIAERAGVTRGVFIHDVVHTPPEARAAWSARGVPFFDTYVGAALHAFELGLISRQGLTRVAHAARDELAAIAFPDDATREARRREVLADLARVDELR